MDWETLYRSKSGLFVLRRALSREPVGQEWDHTGPAPSLVSRVWSSIALTYGTPSFDLEHDPALFELAIARLSGRQFDPGNRADHPGG